MGLVKHYISFGLSQSSDSGRLLSPTVLRNSYKETSNTIQHISFVNTKAFFVSLTFFIFFLSIDWSYAATDRYRCMWQEDPSHSIVLAWDQLSGTNPVLYYDEFDGGDDPSLYSYSQSVDKVIDFKGMHNNFVHLKGLQAGTVYHFIIKDSNSTSQRMSFRTAPDHPYERISIIAGGDSRNFRDARRRANMLVAKLRPHCVMFGGDMTGGDSAKEWIDWFNDWQFTISPEGRLTPILATRGNHEYSNKTIANLFNIPNPNIYYQIKIGGELLQIFTLNSLIAAGGDQRFWLQNELQKSNQTWKLAQYHYGIRPHHTRKAERNTQLYNWAPLFQDFGVNLVVESDAHVVKTTWPIRPSKEPGSEEGFIRDDTNGTVYVGEGCWGAPLRRNNDDKNWTRNSGSFNQFKWIFVDQEKVEVRTVKTDNAENVAAVSPYDLFTPPAGIDLWSPSNGQVLYIYPKGNSNPYLVAATPDVNNTPPASWTASSNQVIGQTVALKKVLPKAYQQKVKVSDLGVDFQQEKVSFNWHSQDEFDPHLVYELQRAVDGKNYSTIAEIKAQGNGGGQYQISDPAYPQIKSEALSYRLKYIAQGQVILLEPLVKKALPVSKPKVNRWAAYPSLLPNPQNGQLKVKYQMENEGGVHIELRDELNKSVSLTEYPQQKKGNYLKTIDMAIFPKGLYLLIVKINEDQVSQYQIMWK